MAGECIDGSGEQKDMISGEALRLTEARLRDWERAETGNSGSYL